MRRTLFKACIGLLAAGCGGGVTGVTPGVDASADAEAAPCPELQPMEGAPCGTPAGWTSVQCEYGPNENFQCNALASCATPAAGGDNRWSLSVPGPDCRSVGVTVADAGPPAGCPLPRPHIGTTCTRDMNCWYPGTPWPLACFQGVWIQDPPQ